MILKRYGNRRRDSITIRVTETELKRLQEQADKYAGGNLSWWLRHAGAKYVPFKDELEVSKEIEELEDRYQRSMNINRGDCK